MLGTLFFLANVGANIPVWRASLFAPDAKSYVMYRIVRVA